MGFRFNGLGFFITDIMSPFVRLIKLDIHLSLFPNDLRRGQLFELSLQLCDGFFSVAYLLLNFACLLFGSPFGLQIAVIRSLSDLLLDGSLHFVEAALDPVFRAGFHISPWPS